MPRMMCVLSYQGLASAADSEQMQRKFNVPVFMVLITHGIVKPVELDAQLAKIILRDFRPIAMEFVANFAHACLIKPDRPILTIGDLRASLHALTVAAQEGRATPP